MKLVPLMIAGALAAASLTAQAQAGLGEVTGLLIKQDYALLEKTFAGTQQRFERGELTEYELREAFSPFAELSDAQALEKLREWAAQSPNSYVAHLALGLSYRAQGSEARGRKSWEDTSPEQREGLIRNFTLAEPELRKSIALTAKPYLSVLNLMAIAGNMQNRPFLNASLLLANEALPDNRLARLDYARYLLPRWGGTYEKFDTFVSLSRAEGVAESTLLKLQAIELNDRAQVLLSEHHRSRAEPLFKEALLTAQHAGGDAGFRAGFLAASVKNICREGVDEPACQPPASGTAVVAPAATPAVSGPLGGDVEHAVVVPTADQFEGVRTEYAWLALRYPAARRTAQALFGHADRYYDRLDVTTKDGQELKLYFDITAFASGFMQKKPATTE